MARHPMRDVILSPTYDDDKESQVGLFVLLLGPERPKSLGCLLYEFLV